MAIITFSKDPYAGAEEFTKEIAEELNYKYIDRTILEDLSKELKLTSSEIKFFEDAKEIGLFKLIDKFTASLVKRHIDRQYGKIDDITYKNAIRKKIEDICHSGDIVVVGLGGQCLLHDFQDVIHFRFIMEMDDKIDLVLKKFNYTRESAKNMILQQEERSKAYIKHFFQKNWDDSHLYHAIFNLSHINKGQIKDFIKNLIGKT